MAIAAVIFFLDSFIKAYLAENFYLVSIPVLKNIFHITIVFNEGAAFGILKGRSAFLIFISVIFVLAFLVFIKKENKRNPLFLMACGMVLGGALSNLCDRIVLGFVVDYIDLRIWPVFNLSDSCITVGAGLLFWQCCKNPAETNNADRE